MIQQETPPLLFDTTAIARNRARSQCMDAGHNFLKAEIADRMQERLSEVNRTFTNRFDLGGMFAPFVPKTVAETYQMRRETNEILDIPHQSADLIISNMAMHWINDLPGLLVQIKNALRPDGLFTASLLGGQTLHELRHAFLAAESEITGGASARVIPFADVKDLGSLMQRAGFALPVTDVDTLTLTYAHPLNLMQELRGMGEANALVGRSKNFLRRSILMRACEIYQEKFGMKNGRIPATFEVMYLTGWHPHESQQKPLKPGSGKVNLADALKAGGPPKTPSKK